MRMDFARRQSLLVSCFFDENSIRYKRACSALTAANVSRGVLIQTAFVCSSEDSDSSKLSVAAFMGFGSPPALRWL
jgi:hypothetical protein